MSVADALNKIRATVPKDVTLVAISKTKPAEAIATAYEAGQRHFGENKAQEMAAKQAILPEDIHWHLVGHLQTNKVKTIASFVHLIHGVDSRKLLREINKRAAQHERVINCLLQVHIAQEESKFGWEEQELMDFLASGELEEFPNVRVIGLMGMATNTPNREIIKQEFNSLKELFQRAKLHHFTDDKSFKELSMGMSGDYPIALEEGSTMIRVGSAIFGAREYPPAQ